MLNVMQEEFLNACENGKMDVVERHVRLGVDLDIRDKKVATFASACYTVLSFISLS